MDKYTYIVPSNSKKQTLIFGFMEPIDLIIAIIGGVITFMLLVLVSADSLIHAIIILTPMVIAVFLVFPIPSYHNTRVLLMDIYKYITREKEYIWRGWCYKYEQSDDESNN